MARTGKAVAVEAGRLDATDWIRAALNLLAERGLDGVRVEPLAKILGVTKGSFYWHFKDREALLEAMLDDWRRRATLQIIDRIERISEPPAVRLRQLLRVPFGGPRSQHGAEIELSIRLWGRHDPRAKSALKEVDELRLRYITQLLVDCGVPPEESRARAILGYSYMRVGSTLNTSADTELMEKCEAAILGC